MNPGGIVLVVAGIWVLCQVLGGDALNRLGLVGADVPAPDTSKPGVQDRGYNNVPHDGLGRPL